MGAGKKTWVYRKGKEGQPRALLVTESMPHIPGETADDFETRIRKTLYGLECTHDTGLKRLEHEFGGKLLKKVWVDNVERDLVIERRMEEGRQRAMERLHAA